jgi:hypothetical protein
VLLILQIASCLGSQFELPTLATISGLDPRQVAQGLWKAMVHGLVVADGENYFVMMDDSEHKHSIPQTPTPALPTPSATIPKGKKGKSPNGKQSSKPKTDNKNNTNNQSVTMSTVKKVSHTSTSAALESIQRLPAVATHHVSMGHASGLAAASGDDHNKDGPTYAGTVRAEVSVTYRFLHDRVRQVGLSYCTSLSLPGWQCI